MRFGGQDGGRQARGEQLGRSSRITAFLGLLALLGVAILASGSARAVDTTPSDFEFLGKLSAPPESEKQGGQANVVFFVDSVHRRLYSSYSKLSDNAKYFREYDLDTPVPRLLREQRVASGEIMASSVNPTGGYVTYDSRRDRFLYVTNSSQPAQCTGDFFCGTKPVPSVDKIIAIGRKTLQMQSQWNAGTIVPGMLVRGITYSREDDRLYVIGFVPSGGPLDPYALSGDLPRTFPVAVAALDPGTGKMLWVRSLPECAVPLGPDFNGATIARSILRPALYFGCIRTSFYPEISGVVRLTITPKASLVDAAAFPMEFFPVSGSWATTSGITGYGLFDYATDRFFLQSQSFATPGTWVFDGGLSAWVGFVGAPDFTDIYGGFNSRLGRYYMGGTGNGSYIVSVDGRDTPVPQGRIFYPKRGDLHWYILTDDATGRMFVNFGRTKTPGIFDWMVYRDKRGPAQGEDSLDYDSLTSGIPEGPNTFSTYSGTVRGFGARVQLVGGMEGLIGTGCATIPTPEVGCDVVKEFFRQSFNFSPSFSDRALSLAQVPALDLRNVGAAADARALALDQTSDGEYQTLVNEVALCAAGEPGHCQVNGEDRPEATRNAAVGDAVREQLSWPHRSDDCLDAGDGSKPKDEMGPGGGSSVACDLNKNQASASTSFGALSVGGVTIASSSFKTESHKDAKLGIVTTTTATVRGVEISIPGTGTIGIGRLIAIATTTAHGMKGTATIEWKRTLEGVSVHDANDKVVFACAEGQPCDPDAARAAMNDVLKTRARIDLPKPELFASDGGAFAGVEEAQSDFINGLVSNNDESRSAPAMQITVFNDGDEKSRLLIQLAAIQASSIYGISALPPDEPFPQGPVALPIPPGIPPIPPVVDGTQFVPPPPIGGPILRIGKTAVFLIRSPKEALLLGLTVLLLGGAVASGWRRRVLVRRLAEP